MEENILKHFRDLYKKGGLSEEEKRELMAENNNGVSLNHKDGIFNIERNLGRTASQYYSSIDLVNSAGLKPEFSQNRKEAEIINNRKEMVLKFSAKVLEDIKKYLSQIAIIQADKKDNHENLDRYQAILKKSDEERRAYHNSLISNLKILIRIININFNKDFPEDLRLAGEAKMADRKGMSVDEIRDVMNQREYFSFPDKKNIFLDLSKVSSDPSRERIFIATWAVDMYDDLTELSEKIRNELKK